MIFTNSAYMGRRNFIQYGTTFFASDTHQAAICLYLIHTKQQYCLYFFHFSQTPFRIFLYILYISEYFHLDFQHVISYLLRFTLWWPLSHKIQQSNMLHVRRFSIWLHSTTFSLCSLLAARTNDSLPGVTLDLLMPHVYINPLKQLRTQFFWTRIHFIVDVMFVFWTSVDFEICCFFWTSVWFDDVFRLFGGYIGILQHSQGDLLLFQFSL